MPQCRTILEALIQGFETRLFCLGKVSPRRQCSDPFACAIGQPVRGQVPRFADLGAGGPDRHSLFTGSLAEIKTLVSRRVDGRP